MSEKATASTKDTTAKSKTSSEPSASSSDGGSTSGTSSESTSSESTSSESTSSESTTSKSTSAGSKGGASSRPISYFSSVSTDDYRDGWDNIFNNGKKPRRAPAGGRPAAAPAALELQLSDLDADLRARLEDAFRRKAKAKRVSYDKRAKGWRLLCEFDS